MGTEDGNVDTGTMDTGVATAEPRAVPDWLQGAEFQELMTDEKSKNILSSYQTPDAAAKAIVEKERLLASGLRVPEKLSDEHIELLKPHIHKILGVPDKPEEYEMLRPEEIPEEIDLSESLKMKIRAFAKENGFPKGSVQGLYELALHSAKEDAATTQRAADEKFEMTRKDTVALMQKYWGPNEFQRLNGEDGKNNGLIDSFVKSRAGNEREYTELIDVLGKTGLSNNPLLFKVLGDAARYYDIMEGSATMTQSEYAATAGAKTLSAEAKNAQRFPNTPASMGGGAPG